MGFSQIPRRLRRWLVESAVHFLVDPVNAPVPEEATNLRSILRRVRPGDVILVAGNARISQVVKLLTRSSWSHVVMYVGDRSDRLTPAEREEWTRAFGKNALKHLCVDADPVRGVHLRPVFEYTGLLLRHCRPEALSEKDIEQVTKNALDQLGKHYDIRHIMRLFLFFCFPWGLLPESLRKFVTDFTLSESDTICSRVLSEAFNAVNYPIRPLEALQNKRSEHPVALGVAAAFRHRGKSAVRLLAGGRLKKAFRRIADDRYREFYLKGARHITPADYDLSRFFDIIKDPDDLRIDYTKIRRLAEDPTIERDL